MKDFTQGNISKQLIYFALPIIAGDFLQTTYNVVDSIWVGRILGYKSLAAISATMPLFFFLLSLIAGLGIATNILVGQTYGNKNYDLLKKVLVNSFLSSIILSLIMTIIGIIFSDFFLKILNISIEIKEQAKIYLIISLFGIIFGTTYQWFSGVLRGFGNSKTPLKILFFTSILNIILDPFFIIGIGPFPKLGVAGSAIATVISIFVSTLIGYFFLIKENEFLNIGNWHFKIDFEIIKKIFMLGIPASFQLIVISFTGIVLMSIVNKFGPIVTASYGIGMRFDQFAFMPAMSIGFAVSSMVAQNLGANKKERIPDILKWGIFISLSFSLIFFIIVNFYPKIIINAFTKDSSVINVTVEYFRYISISYFLFSAIFSFQGILRGAGDTLFSLLFSIISMIIIRIPSAYYLSKTSLHEKGVWLAILLSSTVFLIFNFLYYISNRWQRINLLKS